MQLARVIGRATATVKHPTLVGQRLMLVSFLDGQGKPELEPQLAFDPLGSRLGDIVMMTSDGPEAGQIANSNNCPVRWSIQGIPDEQNLKKAGLKQLTLPLR
jgi:ethanolamine utilization protein EutN